MHFIHTDTCVCVCVCICVCVCVYEISDLPGISLVSDKTNFLVSELGESLLGFSTFFLFSGCGTVWKFLMLLNIGETWGAL